MSEIRNFILKKLTEGVSEIINEDYDDTKEIDLLATDIFKMVTELNGDRIIDWALNSAQQDNYFYFYPVTLIDVYNNSPNHDKFTKLKEFLDKSRNVEIYMKTKGGTTKGTYSRPERRHYRESDYRTIDINISEPDMASMKRYITEKIKSYRDFPQNEVNKILLETITTTFDLSFHSTLIHELQHIYDDFRSDTKAFKSKEQTEYTKLQKKATQLDDVFREEYLESLEMYKKYLNLPHEIWARFTQLIHGIKLTTSDMVTNDNGDYYFKYDMRNLNQVMKDFDTYYRGVEYLTPEMRKRLIRKLSQFWHKEQGRIKIENLKAEMSA